MSPVQENTRPTPTQTQLGGGLKQTLQQTYSPEGSASCVQNFDDSLDSAIRMTYRISLRSSSLWEPRHPLLKVLIRYHFLTPPEVLRSGWATYDEFLITVRCKKLILSKILSKKDRKFNDGCASSPQKIRQNKTHRKLSSALSSWKVRGSFTSARNGSPKKHHPHKGKLSCVVMILPQVHLRKPCYDFTFL